MIGWLPLLAAPINFPSGLLATTLTQGISKRFTSSQFLRTHNLNEQSSLPLISLLSDTKSMSETLPICPKRVVVPSPTIESQIFIVLSIPELAMVRPSGENLTDRTPFECAV